MRRGRCSSIRPRITASICISSPALFVIACGLAFLETSANPLMTELGDPTTAAKRLNWAQAANPVGTVAGVLIGKYFILSAIVHDESAVAAMSPAAREAFYRSEVVAVQTPYLVIGLVVLLFAVAAARDPLSRAPRRRDRRRARRGSSTCSATRG